MNTIRQSLITKALQADFGCSVSAFEEWQLGQQGIYLPTSPAAYLGSTYHHAIAWYYRKKMEGNTPALPDVADYFAEAWIDRGALEHGEDVAFADGEEKSLGLLGEDIILAYFLWLWDYQSRTGFDYEAAGAEVAIERSIPDTDWVVTTRLDLLTVDSKIVDHKTTGSYRFPSQKDIDRDLQATCHMWVLGELRPYEFHYVKKAEPKGDRVAIFKTTRTQAQLDWYEAELQKLIHSWERGEPQATVGWQCGYCNLPCSYQKEMQ